MQRYILPLLFLFIAGAIICAAGVLPLWASDWLLTRDIARLSSLSINDAEKVVHIEAEARKSVIDWLQLVFGGATALGLIGTLIYTARNYRVASETLRVTEYSKFSESLIKAIELLGSGNLSVKIGAIHALGRIAMDAPTEGWRVVEILCSHVREVSTYRRTATNLMPPSTIITDDIAAVMSVLRTLPRRRDDNEWRINLSSSNLNGADLHGADLRNADLSSCDLTAANLDNADLASSKLSLSIMNFTTFRNAELENADFRGTQLDRVILTRAKISKVNLANATGSAVRKTKFYQSKKHMTYTNIKWSED